MAKKIHKAGFVNIVGRPNVGKSTLMNTLVGEKLSIITSKAQTTRHRIIGIVNEPDSQIVFSDTPGIVYEPKSGLHKAMNEAIELALEDADLILYITDIFEKLKDVEQTIIELRKIKTPKVLLINKFDQVKDAVLFQQQIDEWQALEMFDHIVPISALTTMNVSRVPELVMEYLPEHEAFYDKDQLTDKSERFFVSEIIREKIFLRFKKEVPYSTEVIVESWKDEPDILRISATIFVERESQKPIIIGNGGQAIKSLGMDARRDIEKFVGKHIYLELFVKVKDKWRDNPQLLKGFGYSNK